MRKFFFYISSMLCLALIVSCAISVKADNSRYVISAKAGGVNMVSGQVTITRKNTKSQTALTAKDQIEAGDIVTTGTDGRVEITLNPGSYLRLGENSSFELTTTVLDDLRLKLLKGSAVLEAAGGEHLAITIEIITPQTTVNLVKKGIYRLNVTSETTEVQVWKGEAKVGAGMPLKVKSGRTLTIGSANAGIEKLDKKDQDSLDLWSKERAKFFADERSKLEKKTVRQAMSSFYSGFGRFSASFPFYGAWLYSYSRGCRFFIPLDAWAWVSPYGFDYFNAGFGWSFFSGLPWGSSLYCPYTCGGYGYPVSPGTNVNPVNNVPRKMPDAFPTKVPDAFPTKVPDSFPTKSPPSPPLTSPTKQPN